MNERVPILTLSLDEGRGLQITAPEDRRPVILSREGDPDLKLRIPAAFASDPDVLRLELDSGRRTARVIRGLANPAPLFCTFRGTCLDFWDNPRLPSLEPDENAVCEFLALGYLPAPHTLFKNLHFVPIDAELDPASRSVRLDWGTHAPSSPSQEGLIASLRSEIHRLLSHEGIDCFRLSGGLDTRLICLLGERHALSGKRIEVVADPFVPDDDNADLQAALEITSALGLRAEVIRQSEEDFGFLAPRAGGGLLLSGLYGGELLGGICERHLPPSYLGRIKDQRLRKRIAGKQEAFEASLRMAGLSPEVMAFVYSFRSAIYRSVRGSWAYPWENRAIARTPFLGSPVFSALCRSDREAFKDYSAYSKIYRAVAGPFLDRPVCSPARQFYPDLSFRHGVDPKRVARSPQSSEAMFSSSGPSRFASLFDLQGLSEAGLTDFRVRFSNADRCLKGCGPEADQLR